MGCDGGTIPTRDELVRTKKRPERKDGDSERLFHWRHCRLTQEPLVAPVAACGLGRLYNKEAVIKKLLEDKKRGGEGAEEDQHSHLRSLKDVKELKLTPNPDFGSQRPSVGDGYVDRQVAPWICPVTGLEMNGRFRFVLDWSDGRVLSERAYKLLKDDEAGGRVLEENVVILNPNAASPEEDLMRAKMEHRRARAKADKKAGKRKAESKEDVGDFKKPKDKDIRMSESKEDVGDFKKPKDEAIRKSAATNGEPAVAGSSKQTSNGGEAASTSKKGSNGPSGGRQNGQGPSTSKHGSKGTSTKTSKATSDTNLSALQKDPTKSDVFKSLFDSHPSAQNKPKGNWVTFDPRYN